MPRNAPASPLDCFAVTAPGLEAICAGEARSLGLDARVPRDGGGVSWRGNATSIARANLWLRAASRVVVRAARFRATAFYELELQAKRIAWERFLSPGSTVALRVTCRKSKLYHSDAVAERFVESIGRRVNGVVVDASSSADKGDERDDETLDAQDAPAARQLFIVRLVHDECTVSADSSGELLHRRGYRRALAKAPLRETLAASLLLAAEWKGDTPLVDPMCGSGTIPIEAAMLARRMAPGRARSFAFERWPGHDASAWASIVDEARSSELPRCPVAIEGYDRDEGAIGAAQANSERAGVADDICWAVQPISALAPAIGPGLMATNPPYGVRVGEAGRLRDLYAQLGHVARRARTGWDVALVSANSTLERQTQLELNERVRTRNGGIPVRFVVGRA
jgi:putative N6-adenine-specific DNA methylase